MPTEPHSAHRRELEGKAHIAQLNSRISELEDQLSVRERERAVRERERADELTAAQRELERERASARSEAQKDVSEFVRARDR
jgi:hypothetical protein